MQVFPKAMIAGVLVALATAPAAAQPPAGRGRGAQAMPADPVAGNWRGYLRTAQGGETPFIITFTRRGDVYTGVTTGLNETGEVALRSVAVKGARVTVEGAAESKMGNMVLAADLDLQGNTMKGAGTLTVGRVPFAVSIELQRRARAEVVQPQVEQRADYFVGRWTFEYLGGEFPPLSVGSRSGTATFTRTGSSNFVSGRVQADIDGKPYEETLSIGFDPDSNMLAVLERRPGNVELMSVANWRSPLAINFVTSPVQAGGRTYQMRRMISVLSDVSFEMTEEFSVDGGPFRRLGSAAYTKTP